MTIKDWKEIGVAAVVTATVTVGVLSTRPGMSVDKQPLVAPAALTASVGPLTVSGTAHADATAGAVKATVHIANPTSDVQNGKFSVVLSKVTFAGNPGSRVAGPADFKTIQMGSNTVDRSVSANSSVDISVTFKVPAQGAANAFVMPTYRIDVDSNGKQSPLGFATFDAPAKPSGVAQGVTPGGFGAQSAPTVRP